MKNILLKKRTLILLFILVFLFGLFLYVAFRSGPLAAVAVVVQTVERKQLSPSLFGIGTVEARYTYKIGPTFAGRVKHLHVQVGDHVKAGQVLGEMDPVDLEERILAQDATLKRVNSQIREAQARQDYAQAQFLRYKKLLGVHSTSEEVLATKQQELLIAKAGLTANQEELSRVRAEREALEAQRSNLFLIAPVDSLVVSRDIDPGTTVVAGQSVVELIDPKTIWINVRFDQIRAKGLSAGLSAKISLRSQEPRLQLGTVFRVEPLADAVTEEILTKVIFRRLPDPLPPIGELAEVTVELPPISSGPVIPIAAIHHINGLLGVWEVIDGDLNFTSISLGAEDLEGYVQVLRGLNGGEQIVVYSENPLTKRSRIRVVERLAGVGK